MSKENKKIVSISAERANWHFSGQIAQNFDQHITNSVPMYQQGHQLVCELSDFFLKPASLCYEIGCSTGALTARLVQHNRNKANLRFIGIDIEADMIDIAQKRHGELHNTTFLQEDVLKIDLEPCDLIVCYYSIQFIRPSQRQALLDKLYQSLQWGGALVMFEKVRGPDARFQDMATRIYDDFKLSQGFSAEEIVDKARSLKGVLEPFSTQGNIDLLKRAGFVDVMSIMKYVCFEGFVAIK